MRIRGIALAGWLAFKDRQDVRLPPGPIAVQARYRGNPRRSNWAGKTAVLRAIRWCLFGVHHKRTDDSVIHREAEGCLVELDLGELSVRRSRERGRSTLLEVWDRHARDGAEEQEYLRQDAAQRRIEERLGTSLADYSATVDFDQDDIEAIVGRTAGDRRRVFSSWFRLERWADAGKRAARAALAAQKDLVAARAAAAAGAESVLPDAEEDELRERVEDLERELQAVRARVAEIDGELEALRPARAAARDLEELAELRRRAVEVKRRLVGRVGVEGELARARAASELASTRLVEAGRRLDQLASITESGFGGACPVTGGECPAREVVTAEVRRSGELVPEARRERQEASAELARSRQEQRAQEESLREMDRAVGEYNAVTRDCRDLVAATAGQDAASAARAAARGAELEDEGDRLDEEERGLLERLASASTRLEASVAARLRQGEREEELRAAERLARVRALAARALAPSGIPARVARRHVGNVEARANHMLRESGLRVEFAWERELRDLEPECGQCFHLYRGQRDKECPSCGAARGRKVSDDLEILVDDGSGEVEDVRTKSGAAKVLVASALRLAGSAMLRDLRGCAVAWAAIDEPFGPLDAENREGLARTFAGMLGDVGLEQALVVSHDVALLDALPSKLIVERDGSASTLRVEG